MAYRRLLALALTIPACTGFSLGENEPGGDTWTEPPDTQPGEHKVGAIAVERDEDMLWVVHEENRNGVVRGRLAAIDPVSREVSDILDVSGTEDRRVVFPASDRMILMAQEAGTEHMVLIDTVTRATCSQSGRCRRGTGGRGRRRAGARSSWPTTPIRRRRST